MNFTVGDYVYSEEFGKGVVIRFSGLSYSPTPFLHVRYSNKINYQYSAMGNLHTKGYYEEYPTLYTHQYSGVITKIFTANIIEVGTLFCRLHARHPTIKIGDSITLLGFKNGSYMSVTTLKLGQGETCAKL